MSNFINASYWEKVATSVVGSTSTGEDGMSMSPTHVFYVNDNDFVRYNRSALYTSAGSWDKVSLSSLGLVHNLNNFNSSGYDGRYVYFAPRYCNHYVRHDTLGTFTNVNSWEKLLVTDVTPTSAFYGSHFGLTVLGNYIYYCPYGATNFVRYDKTLPFVAGSFQLKLKTDIQEVGEYRPPYYGVCNDGRYIYYAPYQGGGLLVRYDSQGDFTNTNSWETSSRPLAFDGGVFHPVFDGRYVYYSTDGNAFARYDTTLPFNVSSWQNIAKSTVGLTGTITFSCSRGGYVYGCNGDGRSFCYDTNQPFTSASSWELAGSAITGDTGSHSTGFGNADDNYVYFKSGTSYFIRFNGGPLDPPPICWNYTAKYKNSSKLYKASGCGSFPKNIRVPGNVDIRTGKMIDDGLLIDPRKYEVR